MRTVKPSLPRREATIRAAADFAIVHAAAFASLTTVLLWRLWDTPGVNGQELADALRHIYITRFFPLSFIFPAVFAWSGFYSRARSYSTPYKWRVIATGSAAATLIYLFADFIWNRADIIPRSSTIMFLAFVVGGTVGVRWLKHWMITSRETEPPEISSLSRQTAPILVVGGAGYIGCLLCRQLLERGYRVRVLDSLIYGDSAIRELREDPNFELVSGDCRNIQNVVSAVNGVEAIVHLAAIVGDPACEQDRQTALEVNYAATRMLIEIARGNGVGRFIFASSCSVYGATDLLMTESSAVEPISLYAQTKVDSEHALLAATGADFHPTIVRLATVFGHSSRPRFDLVVNLLVAKAYRDNVITIFNGEQWRPFIHVRDVARGLIATLEAPLPLVSGEVFNLGDSRLNYMLTEVAERIGAAFPGTRIEHVSNTDRRNYRVSFDKIRNQLGFESVTSLETGIDELKSVLERGIVLNYAAPEYHNQRFLQYTGAPAHSNEMDAHIMAAFAAPVSPVVQTAAAGS